MIHIVNHFDYDLYGDTALGYLDEMRIVLPSVSISMRMVLRDIMIRIFFKITSGEICCQNKEKHGEKVKKFLNLVETRKMLSKIKLLWIIACYYMNFL